MAPLFDDVIFEILLRLPPDEPEHLFRAALVCKPWLRVLCDPGFRRRYRAFHGAPPLLGLLHRLQVLDGDPAPRFASTTSMPDFPHPGSDADGCRARPLDCRHGRVLFHMLRGRTVDLLVWDPVTGDRHVVPEPDIDWMTYTATVFCAAGCCDHLDCHGGPFRVVFLGTDGGEDVVKASVYSSVTGFQSASLVKECQGVIDLEKIMPMANPGDGNEAHVVGFAEGVDVIFVTTDVGLFTIELKSRLVKKVDEPGVYYSVLPYMSFYTPDRGKLSSLARLTEHCHTDV